MNVGQGSLRRSGIHLFFLTPYETLNGTGKPLMEKRKGPLHEAFINYKDPKVRTPYELMF